MIISFWRYSHLAIALSAGLFILLATLTGIVLAFEPIHHHGQIGRAALADNHSLASALHNLKTTYPEVLSINVDHNGFVSASVIDEEGKFGEFYINPATAQKQANLVEKPKIFEWATNLHRSLFLKSTGRFFMGLTSFLLFLIAVSGMALIIKRQQGLRHIFSKIKRDGFYQFYHTQLGRLSLLPIIIITLTGVYLSLLRFELIPSVQLHHEVNYQILAAEPAKPLLEFEAFQHIALSEVRSVEFPFSTDVEDLYKVNLKTREILVNQYTGQIESELKYPFTETLSSLSLILHTGNGSIIWAIILGLSCVAILFFMYSGFAMTLKRRKSRIKNSCKKEECDYVILVGSENGTTMDFARLFYQQLLHAGKKVWLTEMNRIEEFKAMRHLVVFTSTYGVGEPPANATKFLEKLDTVKISHPTSFAVVGFGSLAYAEFCKYALTVDNALLIKENTDKLLEPYTINNRSWEAFNQWVNKWGEKQDINLSIPKTNLITKPQKKTQEFTVLSRSPHHGSLDDTFTLTLQSHKNGFQSGDLLAVYPQGDTVERLYSIGLVDAKKVFLSIRLHQKGICSNYLNQLQAGQSLKAAVIKNSGFHFPAKANGVVLISTGTGIAPFLGMLQQNKQRVPVSLYWGARSEASLAIYNHLITKNLDEGRLKEFHPAYSRQPHKAKTYVQHLIKRDEKQIAKLLMGGGTIMLCGSVAMQKEIIEVLQQITHSASLKPISHYQNHGQLLMDCY